MPFAFSLSLSLFYFGSEISFPVNFLFHLSFLNSLSYKLFLFFLTLIYLSFFPFISIALPTTLFYGIFHPLGFIFPHSFYCLSFISTILLVYIRSYKLNELLLCLFHSSRRIIFSLYLNAWSFLNQSHYISLCSHAWHLKKKMSELILLAILSYLLSLFLCFFSALSVRITRFYCILHREDTRPKKRCPGYYYTLLPFCQIKKKKWINK